MNNIRIDEQPSRPLAVVRRRATLPELSQVVPAACGVVWDAVRAHQIPGAGRHVAVYLDCEFNLEIGVELESPLATSIPLKDDDLLRPSSTPAGRVAATTHFGPYHQLSQIHDAIQRWCSAYGHALAGPCWEIYGHWKNDWNTDPSKIETDVFYLLR
jgi:effector-binding domain-containing protein